MTVSNKIYIQSPLAKFLEPREQLGTDGSCGVDMQEINGRVQFNLRCDMDALASLDHNDRPFFGPLAVLSPNRFRVYSDYECYWLGPDERLLVTTSSKSAIIEEACSRLNAFHHALTDISDAQTVIKLSGEKARKILMHGSMYDFHHKSFMAGMCTQTLFAGVPTFISCRVDSKSGILFYELYVRRSYADYISLWLIDAASEVGFTII